MSSGNSVEAMLFNRAKDHLSDEDLQRIVEEGEEASETATNAATLASGLAYLLMADGNQETPAGNFQDEHEVSSALLLFAHVFEHLAVRIHLGCDGNFLLRQRVREASERARAASEGARAASEGGTGISLVAPSTRAKRSVPSTDQ